MFKKIDRRLGGVCDKMCNSFLQRSSKSSRKQFDEFVKYYWINFVGTFY